MPITPEATAALAALRNSGNRSTDDELLARIILSCNTEPSDHDVARDVWEGGPSFAIQKRLSIGKPVSAENASAAIISAVRLGIRVAVPGDDEYPKGFVSLRCPPYLLWIRGQGHALTHDVMSRSVSIVGARAATGYGEHVTMEMSSAMAGDDYAVISGAAYGIDGMAHRAALASYGVTVAFLAGGVDRFYPSGHSDLLQRIVETGAVASEMPPGSSPTKWRFLARNRLIAAASQATLVVEAGVRSGSLNAARQALEAFRPVGAVPGQVTSAASAGCHRLIRAGGALLVTNVDEFKDLVLGGAPLPRPFRWEND